MITRTADQILGSALERLLRETPITITSPGSVARTIFEIESEELAYNYRIMDANVAQLYVSSAGGTALDKLGTLFGVTRTKSSSDIDANEGRVYFYLNDDIDHHPGTSNIVNEDVDIVIPTGTLLSSDNMSTGQNPVTWQTTATCVIPVGANLAYASVKPVVSILQTVGEGVLKYHNLGTDNLYVYNRRDLEVREDVESDPNFRFRIVNAINEAAKANTYALRLAALGITGVRDAKVLPLANGIGTVRVIVVLDSPGGDNASAVLTSAATAVRLRASAGDLVEISRPVETRVDLTAVLVGDGITAAMRASVKASIERYLATLSIGDPISTSRIISEAMNISPNIRDFATIDGGFLLNNNPMVFMRTDAGEDEQFFPGTISVL